jgi:hybrid cluster-associated redox disulfide protein
MTPEILPLEMAMADLMARWPQTISVLLRYHMGCVGCAMAPFDTVADTLRIYNLPADRFIADLLDAIQAC